MNVCEYSAARVDEATMRIMFVWVCEIEDVCIYVCVRAYEYVVVCERCAEGVVEAAAESQELGVDISQVFMVFLSIHT